MDNRLFRDLTVVIPVFNGSEFARKCISSIKREVTEETKIILVDDGSSDRSKHIAVEYGVIYLAHEERKGPSSARNTGFRMSASEYILFIDADVVMKRGTIDGMLRILAKNDNILGVNGIYSLDAQNSSFIDSFMNVSLRFQQLQHGYFVETAFTSVFLVRRSAMEKMDGWNEKFDGPYADDIETRWHFPRKSIFLDKKAEVIHLKRSTFTDFIKNRFKIGLYFLKGLYVNRNKTVKNSRSIVLHYRYPLDVISVFLFVFSSLPWLFGIRGSAFVSVVLIATGLIMLIIANYGVIGYLLKVRGVLRGVKESVLCVIEPFPMFAGMLWAVVMFIRKVVCSSYRRLFNYH